jgi:branched-chain amino acid transport system ATP-binding protein
MLLTVASLEARYGSIIALRDVSLEVDEGELVALVGSNGAGKSTTLGVLAGILRPTRGSVMFGGAELVGRSPEAIARLGIAMVPEGRGIFPTLTVAEHLRLGAYLRRDRAAARADLEGVFERFPVLRERRDQLAGTLSGGEQQQLAIGRALLSRPRLLMLDEPSLGLAPTLVDRVFGLVSELHGEGVTILLVEQNVRRTLQIVDRAYLLRTGRIEAAGRPAELQDLVDIESVYLGGGSARTPATDPTASPTAPASPPPTRP